MAPDDIRELFAAFGRVDVRRMFGSAGIFVDDAMFALVHDGVIYLKADEQSVPAFEREGLEPFTYRRRGQSASLPYWRMPDRLYDDPEELAAWAREAVAAVRRRRARTRSSAKVTNSRPVTKKRKTRK